MQSLQYYILKYNSSYNNFEYRPSICFYTNVFVKQDDAYLGKKNSYISDI